MIIKYEVLHGEKIKKPNFLFLVMMMMMGSLAPS
jgi:hypothetical protein